MSILSAGTSNTTSLVYTGDTTGAMVFQTNGTTEAMRITAAQNVGINTVNATTGRLVIAQNNATQPAISLPTDESTIQGPSANTQIRMGGNLVLGAAGQVSINTTGSQRLVVDSSGRITTPAQPAFSAFNSVDFSTGQGAITYNSTAFNTGSNYSTSTGRFTAPVAGYYIFFHRLTTSNNVGFESKIQINGTEVSRSYMFATGSIRTSTTSTIYYLNANDYAEPATYVPSTTTFNAGNVLQSNFYGYLLG